MQLSPQNSFAAYFFIQNLPRYFSQPRLRLAYGLVLVLARSAWFCRYIPRRLH